MFYTSANISTEYIGTKPMTLCKQPTYIMSDGHILPGFLTVLFCLCLFFFQNKSTTSLIHWS